MEDITGQASNELNWYFDSFAFNQMRKELEDYTEGKWAYSGRPELVLLNSMVPTSGPPLIDWPSVQSGPIIGDLTLTIEEIVEAVSGDLERQEEDPHYGVEKVILGDSPENDSFASKVLIGALGGMIAALGKGALGL